MDDHEKALRDILATVDETGRAHGHWHGVAIKIARAAIYGHPADLSAKDWARITGNQPARATAVDAERAEQRKAGNYI